MWLLQKIFLIAISVQKKMDRKNKVVPFSSFSLVQKIISLDRPEHQPKPTTPPDAIPASINISILHVIHFKITTISLKKQHYHFKTLRYYITRYTIATTMTTVSNQLYEKCKTTS